jgi:hypothetical protein
MADYEITFNVFDGSSGYLGEVASPTGHANVTFTNNVTGEIPRTIGANVAGSPSGGLVRGYGATDDGVIQDEHHKLEPGLYAVARRTVPVTKEQYEAISQVAFNLADQRYRYDYSAVDGPRGHGQVCSDWIEAVYQATGHPGTVGDLFHIDDIDKTPGLVWVFIGVNTAGIWLRSPDR